MLPPFFLWDPGLVNYLGHCEALTLHLDSPGRQSSLVMIAHAVRRTG